MRFLFFCLLLFHVVTFRAQEAVPVETPDSMAVETDSITIYGEYMRRLGQLVAWRDSLVLPVIYGDPNPYYYKMMLTPTLYMAPLRQMMQGTDMQGTDIQMRRIQGMNRMLAGIYTEYPWLVSQTETAVKEGGSFRDDATHKLETKDKLAEKVAVSSIVPTMDESIEVVTRRPNFWKFSGNGSLQFSQNHFTENWYQGGEDNYSGNTNINLRLDFNNQKKITWNNQLEFQLGFQTNEADKRRTFRPTSNMIRFTTSFGYKAVNTLYYSTQIRIQTQVVPTFQPNSTVVTSDIFSPMDVTIAPGLKYDIAYGKKKRFTGSLNMAPLAYSIRYCDRDNLVRNYGINEGHNSVHNFGPNITLNTTYRVCNQVTWNSNIYWFSNLHYTKIEWTNTINFSFSKYISAQLYLYPRFDDSAEKFRNENGKFFMFKEYMSMGLNYSF